MIIIIIIIIIIIEIILITSFNKVKHITFRDLHYKLTWGCKEVYMIKMPNLTGTDLWSEW